MRRIGPGKGRSTAEGSRLCASSCPLRVAMEATPLLPVSSPLTTRWNTASRTRANSHCPGCIGMAINTTVPPDGVCST